MWSITIGWSTSSPCDLPSLDAPGGWDVNIESDRQEGIETSGGATEGDSKSGGRSGKDQTASARLNLW